MNNYNPNENRIPLHSISRKIVGWIEGDAICKNVIVSKHMLRKPPGWAWDVSIIDSAIEKGLKRTILFDKENNRIYSAPLKYFLLYGIVIDRRFGKQICLPLSFWTINISGTISQQLSFGF